MGFFDKKYCDVCGEKIGLLGNRKLEDGNLCKDCAAKLSPFFSERKSSTVEEIKQQLAYREENQRQIAGFRATRIIGDRMKVMVDELGKRFVVTSSSDILKANPDIIPLSDVISCNLDLQVDDTELKKDCLLYTSKADRDGPRKLAGIMPTTEGANDGRIVKIGRASCRERV